MKKIFQSIDLGSVNVDLMIISQEKLNASNVKQQNQIMLNTSFLNPNHLKNLIGNVLTVNLIKIFQAKLNVLNAKLLNQITQITLNILILILKIKKIFLQILNTKKWKNKNTKNTKEIIHLKCF